MKPSFSRQQIAQLICDGDILTIYNGRVYKLNSWIAHHPGGNLAILHMVGRDATDEINAYHAHLDIEKKLRPFYFGDVQSTSLELDSSSSLPLIWRPLMPPIQLGYMPVKSHKDTTSYWYWCPASHIKEPLRPDMLEPPHTSDSMNIDLQQQLLISNRYRKVAQLIKDHGLYKCDYRKYLPEVLRYTFLACVSFLFWYKASTWWHYLISAVCLGSFWHQLTFTAHDAGHLGITHNYTIDNSIGILIANFLGGLSIGWWIHNHDVHHIITNHPEHDPDIQHLPFFAISEKFFGHVFSTFYGVQLWFDKSARYFIRFQHRLYYIVMGFARFNLYALSYTFIIRRIYHLSKQQIQYFLSRVKSTKSEFRIMSFRQRQAARFLLYETFGIIVFWTWYITLLSSLPNYPIRFMYLIVSHFVTSPLHVQITLSHFGMSVIDYGPKETFAARQLRTTMDVDCPEYLDFFHGGLQMQVSHHLFPRIPRHNLRSVRKLVIKYLSDGEKKSETEIEIENPNRPIYHEYQFIQGNKKVLGVLETVAQQATLLSKVAEWNYSHDFKSTQ